MHDHPDRSGSGDQAVSSGGAEDLPIELDPVRLQHRMDWEIRRARYERRKMSDSVGEKQFMPIVFPDFEGLKHAALVVAGLLADRPDAVEATREVLEILAIPTIMREGGDGRECKIQRGRVRFGDEPPEPFDVDYEGPELDPPYRRPVPRVRRPRPGHDDE